MCWRVCEAMSRTRVVRCVFSVHCAVNTSAYRAPPETRVLISGKYTRPQVSRAESVHALTDVRACVPLQQTGQNVVCVCCRVSIFSLCLVLGPGVRVPNLEEIHRTDDHAFLFQVRVLTVTGRQGDPPMTVRPLLVRTRCEVADKRAGFRVRARHGSRLPSPFLELVPRVDGQGVILPLGDHQPASQFVAELRRQRQPALVIELRSIGSEKHPGTTFLRSTLRMPLAGRMQSLKQHALRCAPLYPTFPH